MDPTDEPELIKMENLDFWTNTKIKILIKLLKNEKIVSILDIGCGSGFISYTLANKGYQVTGLDISDKIIISAKNRYKHKNLGFIRKNILKNNISSKFDCILLLDVIEHIKNDYSVLKKAKNLLKKGGLLLLKVPAYPSVYGMHDKVHGHYRRYSSGTVTSILKKAGFSVETLKFYDIPALVGTMTLAQLRPVGSEHLFIVKNPVLRTIMNIYYSIELLLPLPFGNSIFVKARS